MGGALIALLFLGAPATPAPSEDQARLADAELLAALAQAQGEQLDPLVRAAHRRLVEHAEGGDPAAALPLAEALYARAPAPWSADSLSLTLSRLGAHERAVAVAGAQLTALPPGPERLALLQRRALAALGAGQVGPARADLGAALAQGSPDAALLLGLLELRAGEDLRARRLFRSVLWSVPPEDPRQAWARRGWGLTMLPPRSPGGAQP